MGILSFFRGLFSSKKKDEGFVSPRVTPEPVVADQASVAKQLTLSEKKKSASTPRSAKMEIKKTTKEFKEFKESSKQKQKSKVDGKASKKTDATGVRRGSSSKK